MKSSGIARSLFVAPVLLVASVVAAQLDAANLPSRWRVHGVGGAGTLELTAEPSGKASGTLLGRPVTGFLAGGHLVLHRTAGDRTEVWDGWLAADPAERFFAGTVTVSDRNGERVRPWYAVPEVARAAGSTPGLLPLEPVDDLERADTLPESEPSTSEPSVIPPPNAVSNVARVDAAVTDRALGRDLSGVWLASEGRVVVTHQGRTVSVLLPDGKRVSGRFTAADTIVVGLRKGCCKGEVHGPAEIRWNDGAVWHRDD